MTAKEIALNFSEKFQANYPKKPLWEMMLALEVEIENYAQQKAKIISSNLPVMRSLAEMQEDCPWHCDVNDKNCLCTKAARANDV